MRKSFSVVVEHENTILLRESLYFNSCRPFKTNYQIDSKRSCIIFFMLSVFFSRTLTQKSLTVQCNVCVIFFDLLFISFL